MTDITTACADTAAGHYLAEFPDAAIDAFLTRGVSAGEPVDWSRVAGGGFQAYGGAIGEVSNEDSAFSHRDALIEFFGGQAWTDPAEDAERMASARAFGAALAPFASGVVRQRLFDRARPGSRAPTAKRSWPAWPRSSTAGTRTTCST